jgi:DNA-binding NtrC family response regulator
MQPCAILLVDDDPDIMEALALALRGPFIVHTARSIADATAILMERHIDVLVTDYDLGSGCSGNVLLDFAAAQFPGVRRILYSGSPVGSVVSAQAVVQKPDVLTLIKAIANAKPGE